MGTTYRRELYMICDGRHGDCRFQARECCADDADVSGRVTLLKLRTAAKRFGWTFDGEKCYCPTCSLQRAKRNK